MGAFGMFKMDSTNLLEAGYDETSGTLRVTFRSGGVYEYYDVPPAIFEGLLNASSAGTFLNSVIKPRYRYRKVA